MSDSTMNEIFSLEISLPCHDIIRVMSSSNGEISIDELANKLQINRSRIYYHINTLYFLGVVTKHKKERKTMYLLNSDFHIEKLY